MSKFSGKATAGGKAVEAVEAGSHAAVLIALVDLGVHQETYKAEGGKPERKADVPKVMLVWELTACPVAGQTGRNHMQARDYTLGFSPRAGLRKMMEGWRGKSFAEGESIDLEVLLGKKCLVSVSHKQSAAGNTYAKLDGISPLPKGMTVPAPKITPVMIGLEDDLPEWLPYLYGEKVQDVRARRIPDDMVNHPDAVGDTSAAGVGADADEQPF